MPSSTKDLSVLGSYIEMNVDSGTIGRMVNKGTFHYIQGTGTITLQGTLQVTDPAVWFDLVDDSGSDISPISTQGVTNFSLYGYTRIRAINTVGGAGNLVSLGIN